MVDTIAGKATQNGFGVGGGEEEAGGHLDHFVILVPDEVPVDRTPEDQLEVGVFFRIACFHQREFLPMNALEAGKESKTQERAHRKSNFGLSMSINVVAINSHLGAGAQNPLNPCCDFRSGTAFSLGEEKRPVSLTTAVNK